jgi:hypothetical protein
MVRADRGKNLGRESVRVRPPSGLTRHVAGIKMRTIATAKKSKSKPSKPNSSPGSAALVLSMAAQNLLNDDATVARRAEPAITPSRRRIHDVQSADHGQGPGCSLPVSYCRPGPGRAWLGRVDAHHEKSACRADCRKRPR